jgi:hypothetical protein
MRQVPWAGELNFTALLWAVGRGTFVVNPSQEAVELGIFARTVDAEACSELVLIAVLRTTPVDPSRR